MGGLGERREPTPGATVLVWRGVLETLSCLTQSSFEAPFMQTSVIAYTPLLCHPSAQGAPSTLCGFMKSSSLPNVWPPLTLLVTCVVGERARPLG